VLQLSPAAKEVGRELISAGLLSGFVGLLYLIAYLRPQANRVTQLIHRSIAMDPTVSRLPVLLVALVLLAGGACLLGAGVSRE
jgi:hypothetical protein